MRPIWQGFLKLSLVSCAVELHNLVTQSERVSFRTLNRETGNRVKRLYIDAQTEEPVYSEDQIKGYEIADGEYVTVEEEEIDAIAIESTHTIDVHSFCEAEEVDPIYLDTPYCLVPESGAGEEAYSVIRDAMAESGMAGLGTIVLHRRERPVLLQPREKVILMTTLRFNYEVRDLQEIAGSIADVSVDREMIELANHIIQSRTADFKPEEFSDRYEEALVDLIKAKQDGRPLPAPKAERPPNVVDLYEALRKSLASEHRRGRNAGSAGAKPTRKSAASRSPKRTIHRRRAG